MKKLNKKGFTLIELLAVIVVLAILMLVAVQNIFPMIANARANSFISTVENIRDSANNKYVSDMLQKTFRDEQCYSVAHLVDKGYVSVNENNIYGYVCVKESTTGGNYEYRLYIVDADNKYLYTTGYTNGTASSDGFITNSASIDENKKNHFYDITAGTPDKTHLASIFRKQGIVKLGSKDKEDDQLADADYTNGVCHDGTYANCLVDGGSGITVAIHVNK